MGLMDEERLEDYEPFTSKKPEPRIKLVAFDDIKLGKERRDLVKNLFPRTGLAVVWGPPKTAKSFWALDVFMHCALGWPYRGRRTQQGPVVYLAAEGQSGIKNRVEAFRQRHLAEDAERTPFYLVPMLLDLVRDHGELITAIRDTLGDEAPVAVVIDTLNRTLSGSESSDVDMSAFVKAADAIRDAFECCVAVIHHCGHDASRPRGHTSLIGAADAILSVKRDAADTIFVTTEAMKDGAEGEVIASKLERVEVGTDEDGEPITSCIVLPAEISVPVKGGPRLTANQATMLALLRDANRALSTEEWNALAKEEAGIGIRRRADLCDIRHTLHRAGLIYEGANGWSVKS